MIVDSMTDAEIVKTCKREYYSQVEVFIKNKLLTDNKYVRYIMKNLKAEEEHYFKPVKFTTTNKNVFYIILHTLGKKDFKKYGLIFFSFMVYKKNNQYYAALPVESNNLTCVFTPHLLSRYQTRFLKDPEQSKFEVIFKFLKHNAASQFLKIDNPKYKDSVFMVTQEGIILGTLRQGSYNWIECKTFITKEMLKGKQIGLQDTMYNILENYLETFL